MWGCHCDGWDANAFRTVCEGKTSAHANDKGRCKDSVQDAPLGEAATVEIFILEKAAHFALKCVDIVTYRSLLLSRFWVYQLYKYSAVLVCPTKKRRL